MELSETLVVPEDRAVEETMVGSDVLVSVVVVLSNVPVMVDSFESVLELEIVDSLEVDGTEGVEAVAVAVLSTLLLDVSAAEVTVGVDDSVLPDGKVETMVLSVAVTLEMVLVLLGRVEAVVVLSLAPEIVLPTVALVALLSLVAVSVLIVTPDIPF